MAAPKGNRFWEARAKHGRNKKFLKPEDLWKRCCEYFEWVEENPLTEEKGFAFQGVVTKETFTKMRAMTLEGLWLFIDCPKQTWHEYRGREGYSDVTTRVEQIIYQQKFSGAAADLLNANIIARDLGLKDHKDHSSGDGSMSPKPGIDASKLSTDTLKELMAARASAGTDEQ